MSIQEIFSNFKRFFSSKDAGISLLMMAVGVGSFFLGSHMPQTENAKDSVNTIIHTVKSEQQGEIIQAHKTGTTSSPAAFTAPLNEEKETPKPGVTSGTYVGSRSGDKYHFPWCSGAKRIKEENKVWFASKEEAEGAGYAPASNCKGI